MYRQEAKPKSPMKRRDKTGRKIKGRGAVVSKIWNNLCKATLNDLFKVALNNVIFTRHLHSSDITRGLEATREERHLLTGEGNSLDLPPSRKLLTP